MLILVKNSGHLHLAMRFLIHTVFVMLAHIHETVHMLAAASYSSKRQAFVIGRGWKSNIAGGMIPRGCLWSRNNMRSPVSEQSLPGK